MLPILAKARHLNSLYSSRGAIFYPVVRNYWNKDFKPGPYPKTKEEREAAAKRYNLLPEEYEPYPDDGMGYGDYPKLPDNSSDSKDPFYPWDYPEHKRNFGEPIHVKYDLLMEERYDISYRPRYSVPVMALCFFGTLAGFALLYYILDDYKMFRPVLAKQYPKPGVVHYSFEPVED